MLVKQMKLKSYLNVGQADEAKVTVKACAPGQTPTYMLGYIQKDKAKTHYEVRSTLLLPLLLRCFLHHAVASCWCMQSLQHWLPVLQIVHSDIPEGVLLNAHEAYQQRTMYNSRGFVGRLHARSATTPRVCHSAQSATQATNVSSFA